MSKKNYAIKCSDGDDSCPENRTRPLPEREFAAREFAAGQSHFPDERAKESEDEKFMKAAIAQAKKAAENNEVPIGCVIANKNRIIARGYNRRNLKKSALAHAEITAIQKACKSLGDWRLSGCTIYITLEPCPMCAGAIVQARISRVVIGAMNPKAGCAGSIYNLLQEEKFNHRAKVTRGVCEKECSELLTDFFQKMRQG